jgi:hypothetical protein
MNRKLHNTTSALLASAGLLVLSLMAASPMPAPSAAGPFAGTIDAPALAGLEAAAGRAEAHAATIERAGSDPRHAAEAVAGLAAVAAELAAIAVLSEALDSAEASPGAGRNDQAAAPRKARRSHQSVAMPFFSFAPRG